MTTNIKSFFIVVIASLFGFSSCKKEDKTLGDITTPEKPIINIQLVGKTAALPNGDGTGAVNVSITSANAINYKVDFGDGYVSPTNTINATTHVYSHIGVKTITITAYAMGKAGTTSTNTTLVDVLKNYQPPAELVTMLTNDASKKWRVDSAAAGNIGVGPLNTSFPDYYQAGPNEKAGQGLYDDEFTFTKAGNGFAHKTNGSIFGKKEYLTDFDAALTGSGDFTLTSAGAANYSETFSYDGVGNTELINFAPKGHMGIYVGSHRFLILSRTDTKMWLRCIGKDGLAWYVKIKAV
jgi:hypothetical protein